MGRMDSLLQAQQGVGVPEGLPFWLLWFLLCVILLLVVFIFLRDKDLRRRISVFLSGARRHMLRLRLQAKLKREREKKAALWRELGKQAWNEDIQAACVEEPCSRLAELDREIVRFQKTWHDVYSRIEALGREHDAAVRRFRSLIAEQEEARRPHEEEMSALAGRKNEILEALESSLREAESAEAQLAAVRRDIRRFEATARLSESDRAARLDKAREKEASLLGRLSALRGKTPRLQEERARLDRRLEEVGARVRVINAAIERIEAEYRERLETTEREIREWQKAKERVQDRIVGVKRLMEPLFEAVGRILDETRHDHEDLAVLYFQIDGVNKAITDLEARLEKLT
jgi:chromosome segregation ATPase